MHINEIVCYSFSRTDYGERSEGVYEKFIEEMKDNAIAKKDKTIDRSGIYSLLFLYRRLYFFKKCDIIKVVR